jgi:hypothetical protein
MRILFLLLLLLNLGYFGWQWQQQHGEAAGVPSSGPLPVAPGAKTLTLLNELGATSAASRGDTQTPPGP